MRYKRRQGILEVNIIYTNWQMNVHFDNKRTEASLRLYRRSLVKHRGNVSM